MKQITLITLACLVLLATAAVAQQTGWGMGHGNWGHNGRMQQTVFTGGNGDCVMDGNMSGQRMMGPGVKGTATPNAASSNWRANPAYQGQVDTSYTSK